MSTITDAIEVKLPLHTVYSQWTQFEEFPRFMEGVEEVRQLDDRHLHWHAKVGGRDLEWDAEIVEQVADQRIAWRSTTGTRNDGLVMFEPTADGATIVRLQLDYEPEGVVEKAGDLLGVMSYRVHNDLEHFKEFIERKGISGGPRALH